MKIITMLLLAVPLVAAETYTADYDHLDIEEIVSNKDTFKSYLDCFIDKAPCDTIAAHFKNDLPEVVEQTCGKCTAAQRHMYKRFLETLVKDYPAEYKEFVKKFDPDSKHTYSLLSVLAKSER